MNHSPEDNPIYNWLIGPAQAFKAETKLPISIFCELVEENLIKFGYKTVKNGQEICSFRIIAASTLLQVSDVHISEILADEITYNLIDEHRKKCLTIDPS